MTGALDQSLMPGARNAITTCLNVSPDDQVWILTDDARLSVGEALAAAARERDAPVTLRRMEEFGQRPFTALPDGMEADLREIHPTVTILATSAQPGELRFRLPLARFLRQELKVRHGHMIGVTTHLMRSGMLADYHRVAELTFKVQDAMQRAEVVRVASAHGTDLTVELNNSSYRWMPFHGLIHTPGQWGNLPEGEICTSPRSISGTMKVDLLGDYFCDKYGLLEPPLTIHIEDGWVSEIESESPELPSELWNYLSATVNGRRVGEFGVGTNEALHSLAGNLLQDEKYPGVHVAFGNPLPEVTGADWSSDIHVDAIMTGCSIWVDDQPLMVEGKFLV